MMKNLLRSKKIGIILFVLAGLLVGAGNVSFGQSVGDYGTRYISGGPYGWSTASNWIVCTSAGTWTAATTATSAPNNTKNVWIRTGSNYSLSGTSTCLSLNVETGSTTVALGTRTLTVSGNWTNNGTISVTTGQLNATTGTCINNGNITLTTGRINITTGTLTNSGSITMGAGRIVQTSGSITNSATGTIAVTGAATITFATGNFINLNSSANVNFGSSAITITGAAVAQTIGGFRTTGTVTCSKASGTATFTGNVSGGALSKSGAGTLNLGEGFDHTFTGVVALSAGILNGGSSTLHVNATSTTAWGGTGAVFNPGTGTVDFGGGAQTLSAAGTKTFNNLTFSGSGIKTCASTTVNGVLSMGGTATVSAAPTYGTDATLQYNKPAAFTTGAEWIANFTASGGVIISNAGVITLNAAKSITNNLSIALGAKANLGSNTHTAGSLTLNGIVQVFGSWGHPSSNAINENNVYFADATGIVNVGSCPAITAILSGTNSICDGSSSNLTVTISGGTSPYIVVYAGGGGGTISSYSSGSNIPVSPSTSTTYTLASVTDANGCDATLSGSAVVTVSNLSLSGLTTHATNVCVGSASTVTLGATSLPNGTYTVNYTLTGSNPQGATDAVMVVSGGNGGAFNTSSLGSSGTTNLTINQLSLSGCPTYATIGNTATIEVTSAGMWLGTTSTDWNTASNWCGGIPTASTDVIIPSGGNQPVIGSGGGLCHDITINNGASLTISGSNTLTVSGNWTNNGAFTPNSSTVIFNTTGTASISGNTFNNISFSGSGTKTLAGNMVVNGDFILSAGTFELSNSTTENRTLTINGNYSQSGGLFDFNQIANGTLSTLYLAGNFTNTAGTSSILTNGMDTPNGIITFNGTGIQLLNCPNSRAAEWVKYVVNSGSIVRLTANLTLSSANIASQLPFAGEFTVNGTIDFGNYTISRAGGVTGAALFTLSSGATLITANSSGINGSALSTDMNRDFNSGANYIFNGSAAQITSAGLPATVGNLTISNTSGVTLTAITNITNNFSITSGKANLGTFTHTAGSLTLGGSATASGSWGSTSSTATHKDNTYFAATTGIVNVTSGSCITGTWLGTTSTDWNTASNWCGGIPTASTDVIIPSGGNQPVIGAADGLCHDITINNGASLTISGSNTLTVSGNWTNNGTFTSGTGTVTMNGTTQIIGGSSSASFHNLAISSGETTLGANITVTGDLSITTSGTTLASDKYQITGNSTGIVTLAGGTTLRLGQSVSPYNNIAFPTNYTTGNINLDPTSTVVFQSPSYQVIPSLTYGNLTLSSVAGENKVAAENLTINGNLTIDANTRFELGSGTALTTMTIAKELVDNGTLYFTNWPIKIVTVTGNLSGTGVIDMTELGHVLNLNGQNNSIGTLLTDTHNSTINYGYTGAGTQQVFASPNYRNLTLSGSGTKTAGGAIAVNGTTAINGATLNSGSFSSSLGVLTMGSSSTIALGTGTHTIAIDDSHAASWTGTLSITGWTGIAGASGSAGKIFVGVGGLSATQLANVSFTGYASGALILPVTGELVPVLSEGPALSISGTTNHGSACVATAATTIQYTITNTGADASGVTVASNDPQFVVSNLSSTAISTDGTATYDVTFTPNASGSRNAIITVASTTSGSNSPTSSLTGTGNPLPSASVTPSPANAASSVCYLGAGAISSVSWATVSGATSYDVYFGAGSLPGSVTSNVPANSYITGTLSASTTYYWKVVPINACGEAIGASTWAFTTAGAPCVTACDPIVINANGQVDWISEIEMGSFSKSSGASNYSDFTSDVINLDRNTSQNITLTPGFSASSFGEYWKVWIDLNKDGDFFDSGEELFSGNSASEISSSIAIPDITVNTTMRVAMQGYHPGDRTASGGNITANAVNSPNGEDIAKLVDNNIATKYLTFNNSGWVQYQFPSGNKYVVTKYSLSSANDAEERDPRDWTLQGSNDGSDWTTIDTRVNEDFPTRFLTREFICTNTIAYEYYRLNMTNNSGTILQIAEWELFEIDDTPYPDPCEAFAYGEVEDYTVNIAPACVDGTLNLTSPTGTDDQTVCIHTPIASITYAIGGEATGATVTGLPSGVTHSFGSGTITISGSPGASSSYTITTTGTPSPCTEADITGSITVNALPVVTWSGMLANQCISSTSYTLTGGLPAGGTYSGTGVIGTNFDATTAGVGTKTLTYTYTDTNGCTNTATNTITISALPDNTSDGFIGNTICAGSVGTLTFNAIDATFFEPYTISYSDGITTWEQSITSASSTTFNVAVNPNATTIYSLVSITNGNGCVRSSGFGNATAQITVTPNITPTVSIDVNPGTAICSGTSVTFTAIPTNGGTTPAYQWKKNGTNVGTNSATYTDGALVNADAITCILTSNATSCLTNNPATSNIVVMTVEPLPVGGSVSGGTIVCSGSTSGLLTLSDHSGTVTKWQSLTDGTNWTDIATDLTTYTSGVLTQTTQFRAVVINGVCDPATSSPTTVTVPVISITDDVPSSICQWLLVPVSASASGGTAPYTYSWEDTAGGPYFPGNVTTYSGSSLFISTNGISAGTYPNNFKLTVTDAMGCTLEKFYSVTVNPSINYSWIAHPTAVCAGENGTIYTAEYLNNTTYTWTVSGGTIASGHGTNSITVNWGTGATGTVDLQAVTSLGCTQNLSQAVTIRPILGITLGASPTVCFGATIASLPYSAKSGSPNRYNIDFDATANTAGLVDITSATLGSAPGNIPITLPVNLPVGTYNGSLTLSNFMVSPVCTNTFPVTVTVDPNLPAGVSIAASATTICSGTSVTLTATPTNGGAAPTYQWYNGAGAIDGANNAIYTSTTLANGDVITVQMTSNAPCATGSPASSSGITMSVTPTVGTPVFALGATSTRCQEAGSVTYTATATNNTGITYTLDTASINAGNIIAAGTGQVTYMEDWNGNTTITARATGCNGPVTATHTVTVNPKPSVGNFN